ncbi:MAG: hypothetical protein IPK16_20755 [Anaerolineales bacterium]|nr:hypothetical protein [Anaerolineales bacterium]
MSYVLTSYVIISAVAAAVAFFVAAVAWQRRDSPGGGPLVGLMVAVGIWSAGAAMEYATVGISGKILWAKFQYIGVLTCPVFFFLLAMEYDHLDHWLNRRRVGLLFIVPLITFLLAITTESSAPLFATPICIGVRLSCW